MLATIPRRETLNGEPPNDGQPWLVVEGEKRSIPEDLKRYFADLSGQAIHEVSGALKNLAQFGGSAATIGGPEPLVLVRPLPSV